MGDRVLMIEDVDVDGHDEVAALARSFNHAADRIEHLLNAQRSMLASASHELRTDPRSPPAMRSAQLRSFLQVGEFEIQV